MTTEKCELTGVIMRQLYGCSAFCFLLRNDGDGALQTAVKDSELAAGVSHLAAICLRT
jgi:hypothetical protein